MRCSTNAHNLNNGVLKQFYLHAKYQVSYGHTNALTNKAVFLIQIKQRAALQIFSNATVADKGYVNVQRGPRNE